MFFATNADLFSYDPAAPGTVEPWKPVALRHDQWPPDYRAVYAWRLKQLNALRGNPSMLASARAYYSTRPGEFIMHWMDTFNPRKSVQKWMPFVFFWRQTQFIEFLHELRRDQESGLVEKCRDAGATWLACGYSIWSFLFIPDDAIGWGSRKADLVDTLGDPDSIFEKMRLILKRLPDIWMPKGWNWRNHSSELRLINPENGATITGEGGDNIGRGGRKSIYFKDESAHYERPEKIEAALGDNTNVQVDISSVNGLGNVFHRRRESGVDWLPDRPVDPGFVRVFVIDWSDHPEKTEEWYQARKAKAEREGMQHIFAQEVDRNYAAARQNTIIDYEWIRTSVDAHLRIPCLLRPPHAIPNTWMAGLDVADEGLDRNALSLRQWIILRDVEEWGERDAGVTMRRTISALRRDVRGLVIPKGIKVQADLIGVGSGVKVEYNRLIEEKLITRAEFELVFWNAGGEVVNKYDNIIPDDEESPTNKDFFANFKAQAWWSLRTRFYKTYMAITHNAVYPADELISLDGNMPLLQQVMKELAQPERKDSAGLRTLVDKKPKGTKSPNLGDSVVQVFFPAPDDNGTVLVGGYG